jgi:hypothetical protein
VVGQLAPPIESECRVFSIDRVLTRAERVGLAGVWSVRALCSVGLAGVWSVRALCSVGLVLGAEFATLLLRRGRRADADFD